MFAERKLDEAIAAYRAALAEAPSHADALHALTSLPEPLEI